MGIKIEFLLLSECVEIEMWVAHAEGGIEQATRKLVWREAVLR